MKSYLGLLILLVSTTTHAAVTVSEVWIRTTVPGQKVAGAYLQLTSTEDAKLTGGTSSISEALELHEMSMQGDVMRMRRLDSIELPAGKKVELKPGGYHIMLMDIKSQIKEGDVIPLELIVTDRAGKTTSLRIEGFARASSVSHQHK